MDILTYPELLSSQMFKLMLYPPCIGYLYELGFLLVENEKTCSALRAKSFASFSTYTISLKSRNLRIKMKLS